MQNNTKDSISHRKIRGWLENYQALIGDDKTIDDIPRSSGYKTNDGITENMLNRVMLSQGLTAMRWEAAILYRCCRARWIDRDDFCSTLQLLHLTKHQYYRRCDWSVEFLYCVLNGLETRKIKLLQKLKQAGN